MSKSSDSDVTPLETERSKRKKILTFEVKDDHVESEQLSAEEEDIHKDVCKPYDGYDKIAERFVKKIINEASEQTKSIRSVTSWSMVKQDVDEATVASASICTFTEYFDNITPWPSIQDFTVEAGREAIEDYMSNWYYEEDWIYDIELVLVQSDDCSDYYTYEVKWGIPTKAYPIPQATASVFFTLDVSRVKPPECQIDVTYLFEGCSYEHVPFKHEFKEEWLFRIVETKLRFFQSLRF